ASPAPAVTAPPGGRPGAPPDQGSSGLPRAYEDSPPPESASGEGAEVATQIYRPSSDETARRSRNEPVAMAQTPEKRGVPLVLVLLGFLLVGFVVVASVMMAFKR